MLEFYAPYTYDLLLSTSQLETFEEIPKYIIHFFVTPFTQGTDSITEMVRFRRRNPTNGGHRFAVGVARSTTPLLVAFACLWVLLPSQLLIPSTPDTSAPLCDECLKIVQKATPIDLAYVDVRGRQQDEHPHMGARDEKGNYGYVHDETALRLYPEPFDVNETDLREMCLKRDDNYKMLREKVFVDLEYDKHVQLSREKQPKIMCIVFNTGDIFGGSIPSIRQTYG